jgi:hypothetical protein
LTSEEIGVDHFPFQRDFSLKPGALLALTTPKLERFCYIVITYSVDGALTIRARNANEKIMPSNLSPIGFGRSDPLTISGSGTMHYQVDRYDHPWIFYIRNEISTESSVNLKIETVRWRNMFPPSLVFNPLLIDNGHTKRIKFPVVKGDLVRIYFQLDKGKVNAYLTDRGDRVRHRDWKKTSNIDETVVFEETDFVRLILENKARGYGFKEGVLSISLQGHSSKQAEESEGAVGKDEEIRQVVPEHRPERDVEVAVNDVTPSRESYAHVPSDQSELQRRVLGILKSFPRITISKLSEYCGLSESDARNLMFELIGDDLVSGRFNPETDEFISTHAAVASKKIRSDSQSVAKCMHCGKPLPQALKSGDELTCPSCGMVNVG